MKSIILTSIATAGLLALGCETVSAESPKQEQQTQQQQAQQQQSQQEQPGQTGQTQTQMQGSTQPMTQVFGTIAEMKTVQLRGKQGETHQALLLETEEGRRIIADLGPSEQLQGMKLEKGKEIGLIGRTGRVGDRVVLFTEKVKYGQQEKTIERPEGETKRRTQLEQKHQQMAMKFQQPTKAKSQKLKGQVVQQKEVGFQGRTDTNTVVLMQTEEGKHLVVDLGPTEELQEVDIKQGVPVEVEGTLVTVGDRLVVMGEQLNVGQKQVSIQRKQDQRQARADIGQRGQRQQQQKQQQQKQQQD